MKPRHLVLALLLLAGCADEPAPQVPPVTASPSTAPSATVASAAPSARPTASPTPRRDPRKPPTPQDISGRYHLALEQQSTAGPTYECVPNQHFQVWVFEQSGAEVNSRIDYDESAPKPAVVEYRREFLTGTNTSGNVIMEGEFEVTDAAGNPQSQDFERVKYELRFVEATGHLVGTRNNERFYLRPLLPGNEEKCQ